VAEHVGDRSQLPEARFGTGTSSAGFRRMSPSSRASSSAARRTRRMIVIDRLLSTPPAASSSYQRAMSERSSWSRRIAPSA